MSRRIALTFVALIAALLVVAVVPIGVAVDAKERESFRFDAISAGRQISSAAEEYLTDHHPPTAMNAALADAAKHHDCAAVYGPDDSLLASAGCSATTDAHARALVVTARTARDHEQTAQNGAWFLAAVPVSDDDKYSGTVVFGRSTGELDEHMTVLWVWLGLTGLAALILGVALSLRLARWVSRPLSGLGAAAARLGDGELTVRAETSHGPAEVRALAATFNRMAERTQTLVHGHRAWVADVSHQLRTPLTALRLRLDVLAAETEGGTAAELAGALEEIGRLSRLVDGLLAVARAEGRVPRREPVDVGAVAAERVAAWEPLARERRIELELPETAGAIGSEAVARLGAGDLEQMLDNVLANALEAVPDAGRVQMRVSRVDGRVLLHVIDNGPGMDEPAKQAAFRRFGNPDARGNGLGLAIVHRLITANGGAVRLTDTPGGGLTVELDLPSVS
ncbi:MAG TPA: HAMP domain-containing sensor histidine kinase [Actinocrinis sp.]|uniref:HAMP domain-containing sensor histidine kinase n=1 Tax=Actinocrinis sp. TaxID=1920516 RepID=UPI002D37881B|nr:HAMP domain-containing sensor histidine kinase [Actinocrinis sp.]HZU56181.1 HAMP domain-containing sensor histidine kinase [Actinocrinis sp.]